MKVSVDSSGFVKRYVQEAGSEQLDVVLRDTSELACCVILVPEIVSALTRRLREGCLTLADYRLTRNQLLTDVRDMTILDITSSTISRSLTLLENNVLRAMDALHVACALGWGADLFVTSDKRQMVAAMNAGLRTEYLG